MCETCDLCDRIVVTKTFEGASICLFCLMFLFGGERRYDRHTGLFNIEAWHTWDMLESA